MKLSDLKKTIGEMSDDDLQELIRETRNRRLERVSRDSTSKKKKEKEGGKGKTLLDSLSPEEAEKLLELLGDRGEE